MLLCLLVSVGLAYGAALIRPGIPDMTLEVVYVARLLLPYPQQLVYTGLEGLLSEGKGRELAAQILSVHHAEAGQRICRGTVFPMGPYRLAFIVRTV